MYMSYYTTDNIYFNDNKDVHTKVVIPLRYNNILYSDVNNGYNNNNVISDDNNFYYDTKGGKTCFLAQTVRYYIERKDNNIHIGRHETTTIIIIYSSSLIYDKPCMHTALVPYL